MRTPGAGGAVAGVSASHFYATDHSPLLLRAPVSQPIFFGRAVDFHAWLAAHHASATELQVGFHKKGSGTPSMTWKESVLEALCYGWIDGVRHKLDETRYTVRFTPRKPTSVWSAVNIASMQRLIAEGRVQAAGLRAFAGRSPARSEVYAYEQETEPALDAAAVREFRAHRAAWTWFQARPAGYRRTAIWRIVSAKRPETRAKRLATLIACSADGRTIPELTRAPASGR